MIAASIAVAALVMWLVHTQQVRLHRDNIRVLGVTMTRVLSGADLSQLIPHAGKPSIYATIDSTQAGEAFAYRAIVDLSGNKLLEFTSKGEIVPVVNMPTDTTSWFGESLLASPSSGRAIREYFGPVLKNGDLAGFVRSGYYDDPQSPVAAEISYSALLSLPVFLLTAMSYFLIRRELRPLAAISRLVDECSTVKDQETPIWTKRELRYGVQRLEEHLRGAQSQIKELEAQYRESRTASHLLSYRLEKAQSILDAIPDAILILDDTLVPVFSNPKIEPLLGMSQAELIGKPPEIWCQNKEALTFLLRLRQQNGSKLHTSNTNYSTEDLPQRKISLSTFPLATPRDPSTPFGTLVIFRDISGEHHAKQAGTNFVAQVSHELKTPLSTLLACSELLLDYSTLSESERVNTVNVIHEEVERAAALINNLLNISKLEAGTLPITRQRVRLAELLRDSAEKVRTHSDAKGVQLEIKISPDLESIALDKELFRIAIDNLLSNAIKYSDSGSTITLTAARQNDNEMRISIRDQGIGMSPEDCKHAFEKFFRSSDSSAALRSGHGLGLHLAMQIVELHHGKLSISSEVGKGTEFTIVFPIQSARLQEGVKA